MSDSVLERSLDDIIGDRKKPARKGGYAGKRIGSNSKYPSRFNNRAPPPPGRHQQQSITFRRDGPVPAASRLPRDVLDLSRGRPVLRVKNIHPDLNGVDLSNLFGTVSPVDFVKFDNKNDTIAYVCFHNDNQRSNGESVNKFDGKKAMGNRLIVEVATSLADRIQIPANNRDNNIQRPTTHKPSTTHKPKFQPKPRQPKPIKVKKTPKDLDTLDEELNAYMNQTNEPLDNNSNNNNNNNNNDDDMNLD